MDTPVEAEVKYEILSSEYKQLPELLLTLGFVAQSTVVHEDHYVAYEKSSLGGFNFDRARIVKTEGTPTLHWWNRKTHALDSLGNKIRLEEPKDLTEEQFGQMVAEAPANHPVVLKHRQDFVGKIGEFTATVSLDSILIGGKQKYFVEAEIMSDMEHGHAAKELCARWLGSNLRINTLFEAPSYINQFLSTNG